MDLGVLAAVAVIAASVLLIYLLLKNAFFGLFLLISFVYSVVPFYEGRSAIKMRIISEGSCSCCSCCCCCCCSCCSCNQRKTQI